MNALIRNKSISNTVSHFLAACISIVTSFATLPAVVHGVGLTEFGIWAIATTIVGYMALLDVGLSQTLIKKSSALLAKRLRREKVRYVSASSLKFFIDIDFE